MYQHFVMAGGGGISKGNSYNCELLHGRLHFVSSSWCKTDRRRVSRPLKFGMCSVSERTNQRTNQPTTEGRESRCKNLFYFISKNRIGLACELGEWLTELLTDTKESQQWRVLTFRLHTAAAAAPNWKEEEKERKKNHFWLSVFFGKKKEKELAPPHRPL